MDKLDEEQAKDEKDRDECIKNRKGKTTEAKKLSQEMDDNTDLIGQKNEEIAELKKNIQDTVTEITDLEKELQEATDLRNLENQEYQGNKAAVSLIESTQARLKKFYEDNGLAFAQVGVAV